MHMRQGIPTLVTGGTGMIGRELVSLLHAAGAAVRVVSMDDPAGLPKGVEAIKASLMSYEACRAACAGMEQVFHVAGIKVGAGITKTRPASIFVPNLLMNTNVMEAARESGVKRFLFTSSVGVYPPAEVFFEDDMWKGFPSPNDRFAGWAKRMGEMQVEAYATEYGWKEIAIVRPANVYGRYDNFDPKNAMVVPALIRRIVEGENPLSVWGDGSEVRDFIHATDVARGMMIAMEHADGRPVNLGSGTGISIKDLVRAICGAVPHPPEVVWDISKKAGDRIRVMDISRARSIGYEPSISFTDGIRDTVEWFIANKVAIDGRYNVFNESARNS